MILCSFLLGIQLVILLVLEIFKVFIVVSIFVNILICSRIFFFILEIRNKQVVNYIIINLICILNALIVSCPYFIIKWHTYCFIFHIYSCKFVLNIWWDDIYSISFDWMRWNLVVCRKQCSLCLVQGVDAYSGYLFFALFAITMKVLFLN